MKAENLEVGALFTGRYNGKPGTFLRCGGGIVNLSSPSKYVIKRRRDGSYPDIDVDAVVCSFGGSPATVTDKEVCIGDTVGTPDNHLITVTMTRRQARLLNAALYRITGVPFAEMGEDETLLRGLRGAGIRTEYDRRERAFVDGRIDNKALFG